MGLFPWPKYFHLKKFGHSQRDPGKWISSVFTCRWNWKLRAGLRPARDHTAFQGEMRHRMLGFCHQERGWMNTFTPSPRCSQPRPAQGVHRDWPREPKPDPRPRACGLCSYSAVARFLCAVCPLGRTGRGLDPVSCLGEAYEWWRLHKGQMAKPGRHGAEHLCSSGLWT